MNNLSIFAQQVRHWCIILDILVLMSNSLDLLSPSTLLLADSSRQAGKEYRVVFCLPLTASKDIIMPVSVQDKLFIITGSAGGLGKAFAAKLLSLGGKVCLSDVNEALGEETLRELSDSYGDNRVAFVPCDVTKEESVENLIDEAERKLGTPLYCFVNNAGVMGEKEGWRLCMEINLTGVLHGTTIAIRRMGKDGGGGGCKITI